MNSALKDYLTAERGRQSWLAEQVSVSRSYLSDVSSGKKAGSIGLFRRISHVTGIPLADLMGQRGFAEPGAEPFDYGGRKTSIDSAVATLCPGLRNPTLFRATGAFPGFQIAEGDMLVVEQKFSADHITPDDLVIAQLVSAQGTGQTTIARVALPWVIGQDARAQGVVGTDAAVLGIVRGLVRASTTETETA